MLKRKLLIILTIFLSLSLSGESTTIIANAVVCGPFTPFSSSPNTINEITPLYACPPPPPPPPPSGDTYPPSVSINSPSPGANIVSVTTIRVSASDSSGISYISIDIDGNTVAYAFASTSLSYSWNPAGLTGSHTIKAYAKDNYNNPGSKSISVTTNVRDYLPERYNMDGFISLNTMGTSDERYNSLIPNGKFETVAECQTWNLPCGGNTETRIGFYVEGTASTTVSGTGTIKGEQSLELSNTAIKLNLMAIADTDVSFGFYFKSYYINSAITAEFEWKLSDGHIQITTGQTTKIKDINNFYYTNVMTHIPGNVVKLTARIILSSESVSTGSGSNNVGGYIDFAKLMPATVVTWDGLSEGKISMGFNIMHMEIINDGTSDVRYEFKIGQSFTLDSYPNNYKNDKVQGPGLPEWSKQGGGISSFSNEAYLETYTDVEGEHVLFGDQRVIYDSNFHVEGSEVGYTPYINFLDQNDVSGFDTLGFIATKLVDLGISKIIDSVTGGYSLPLKIITDYVLGLVKDQIVEGFQSIITNSNGGKSAGYTTNNIVNYQYLTLWDPNIPKIYEQNTLVGDFLIPSTGFYSLPSNYLINSIMGSDVFTWSFDPDDANGVYHDTTFLTLKTALNFGFISFLPSPHSNAYDLVPNYDTHSINGIIKYTYSPYT